MNSETIRQHRATGRGRTVFWGVIAGAIVAAVLWTAPTVDGRQAHGQRNDRGRHARSLTELATMLRQSTPWLAIAGLDAAQAAQLADVLERHGPAFDALEAERAALTERVSTLLTAEPLDPIALDMAREEAERLAGRALDDGLQLLVETAELLTPEQRAELVRHWGAQ